MERRHLGSGLLAFATVALVACGGASQSTTTPPKAADKPAATTTTTTAPVATVAKGDFGVPECDEYMSKYLACIDGKVPEAQRAMLRQSLDQAKAAWKQAAATPEGRQGLATGCKAATDAAKQAMQAYGCSW